MNILMPGLVLTSLLAVGAGSLAAHHAVDDRFDFQRGVVLVKGAVARVELKNPHNELRLSAKDATGKVTQWWTDGPSPVNGSRQGWNKDTLKAGDEITICGLPSQAGKVPPPDGLDPLKGIRLMVIYLPDGRALEVNLSAASGLKCPTSLQGVAR
jgi:hypothetical protein